MIKNDLCLSDLWYTLLVVAVMFLLLKGAYSGTDSIIHACEYNGEFTYKGVLYDCSPSIIDYGRKADE